LELIVRNVLYNFTELRRLEVEIVKDVKRAGERIGENTREHLGRMIGWRETLDRYVSVWIGEDEAGEDKKIMVEGFRAEVSKKRKLLEEERVVWVWRFVGWGGWEERLRVGRRLRHIRF
jgi:hypothetical protein